MGTQAYDAFGATRSQTGVQLAFTYTGEQLDSESGLVYLRARYMDPANRRLRMMVSVAGRLSQPRAAPLRDLQREFRR